MFATTPEDILEDGFQASVWWSDVLKCFRKFGRWAWSSSKLSREDPKMCKGLLHRRFIYTSLFIIAYSKVVIHLSLEQTQHFHWWMSFLYSTLAPNIQAKIKTQQLKTRQWNAGKTKRKHCFDMEGGILVHTPGIGWSQVDAGGAYLSNQAGQGGGMSQQGKTELKYGVPES